MNKDDSRDQPESLRSLIQQLDDAIGDIGKSSGLQQLAAVLNSLRTRLDSSVDKDESSPHQSDRRELRSEVSRVQNTLSLNDVFGSNAFGVIARDARRLHRTLTGYIASLRTQE